MKSLMMATASAVALLAACSAEADPYLFGFTDGGAATELVLAGC